MEFLIPLAALSGLYVVSKQQSKKSVSGSDSDACANDMKEGFEQKPQKPVATLDDGDNNGMDYLQHPSLTSIKDLNVVQYTGGSATDKYFNPASQDYSKKQAEYDQRSAYSQKQYTNLAGQTVDHTSFKHNNMVPYFGSHVRSHPNSDQQESLFDSYLGTGSQTIDKREQAPLFSPNENYNWVHGTPNRNDFIQSRVNPVQKMSNVLPFQQETVGPGLALGYCSDAAGGFNAGMLGREQWLPRNVDQLRATTNQKAGGFTLLGHEGPALSQNPTMGSIGTVEKNRVDTTYENGEDRWLKTTGGYKADPHRPQEVDRITSRQTTTTDYAGIAGAATVGEYVDGEYMPSHRHQLGAVPITAAYAAGSGNVQTTDYGLKSGTAYMNNRAANQNGGYFGAIANALGSTITPLLDTIRPSRKQNVIGSLRPYGDAGTAVSNSYVFNPADRPGTTIRETTENSKFHLNVNANQLGGAYQVSVQQPIANNRMNQSDFFYAGNSSAAGESRQPRQYDAEYRQRNNDIKSSTIDGRLVPGNMALMNNQMNIRGGDRNNDLANHRAPVAGSSGTYQAPSIETHGQLQGKQPALYSGMQADRSQDYVLDALKGNPYALNVTCGL